jgi:hypothetical protein
MRQRKEKQDLEGKFFPVLDAVLKPIKEAAEKKKPKAERSKKLRNKGKSAN